MIVYKVGDGKFSCPQWIIKLDPKIAHWGEVVKYAWMVHDYDHATRKLTRWKSTENFKARMTKEVVNHCMKTRSADLNYLIEGLDYVDLFVKGVTIGGWYDWYIVQPLLNPIKRFFQSSQPVNRYRR